MSAETVPEKPLDRKSTEEHPVKEVDLGDIIEVVHYNPEWPRLFQEEAEKVAKVLDQEVVSIHHMGSTAIPGIKAKPILDILIEVRNIERVDRLNDEFAELGYEARGEFGIPGRRFFVKKDRGIRTHHLHAFQSGHSEIERVLAFRDYLAAHPEEASAYSHLKETLAQQFRRDRDAYTTSKTDFIREIDRKARVWKPESKQD